MKINKTILLNLQKNKNDKLNFLSYTIKLLKNETIKDLTFNNENLSLYFDISKNEIRELINNSNFNSKKKSIIENYELILNKINQFKIKSIEDGLKKEILFFLTKNKLSTQCIILEFNHYHNPKPFIHFYGKNDYELLDGSSYEKSGFYGETIGWFESKISFESLYKPIYNLEWLENDFGLNELFYTFPEYILSEIFLIFYKVFKNIELEHPKLISPIHLYIREHDIEPFSLYVTK